MPIRAVIFDLDGTLIDSMDLVYEAFQISIEDTTGRRPSREEIRQHFGFPESRIIGRMVGPRLARATTEEFHRVYESRHRDRVKIFDGVPELLEQLSSADVILGLVTGKGRRSTEFALKESGLDRRFMVVVTGDDVSHPKPHPEGLLKAIGTLGVRAAEALYVGDAEADIDMGHSALVTVALAGWNTQSAEAVPDSLIRFMHPAEVLSWLQRTRSESAWHSSS